MTRFKNIPSPSDLVHKVMNSGQTGRVSLCLALVLCVAVMWTAFFFVALSGLLGAALGIWLHYGQDRDNPLQVLRPFRWARRLTIVLIVSAAGMALALSLFFSGLFTPDSRAFLSGMYMTGANGIFSFSAAFFTAGVLVISDARAKINAADAVQLHTWQQTARPIRLSFLVRSFRKA
ncbi:hypothetical protein [uncultured Roseobacter sp.]|uniref:hypothetical protein n=1 Tax=uncultured Roseobacter sp. TaxID=114847 RepID=UPI002633142E|nr:hypothetical protein [uncultured Roseobacter sp.]